ncbi:MAG TPA: hypothetical protein VHL08_07650 [Dongiaceae bacterium]|jgi:acetyl esterase|nr:hypothetical protein [Dongiaceae bacterium]
MELRYAPGIAEFIERGDKVVPPDFYTGPIPEQRRLYENLIHEFVFERPANITVSEDLLNVDDRTVRVRVYRPKRTIAHGPALEAALLFMHGGGFVHKGEMGMISVIAMVWQGQFSQTTGLSTIQPTE